ncbi:MAG TPA: ABC transporter ATP-binding protein [Gemmatimonadaceae bacterium]|nr:ABC transporter ATP-binding protein [Gemmatimonadaceae bacterium]
MSEKIARSMIRFDDVVVRYAGARANALDGVSFDVPSGAMTAVAGPNGSGKSTLVRALLRRQPLVTGQIMIGGESHSVLTQRELARRVAVAPQREDTAFPMRVDEYVSLARYPRLGLWESPSHEDNDAVMRALDRAGVSDFASRRTDELSGGEWQRVRIARALAQEGSALVLDEPTTFLDMPHEMSLFELLDSLARDGLAVLVVSHQLNLLARFARTMVLLDRGKVAASGAPGDVMRASVLEEIYDWPLVVTRDPASGTPALLPLRRPTALS